jgi:hypothetical protein
LIEEIRKLDGLCDVLEEAGERIVPLVRDFLRRHPLCP